MTPKELQPDEDWLAKIRTSRLFSQVIPKLPLSDSDRALLSSPDKFDSIATILHRGSRSEVYSIALYRKNDLSEPVASFVLKRYLSPDESVQMRAGVKSPSDKRFYQMEYENLFRFHKLNREQVMPYHYDPDIGVLAMEQLQGSYHTRLSEYYDEFKKNRSSKNRSALREKIKQDLDAILHTTSETLIVATRYAQRNPTGIVLRRFTFPDLVSMFENNISALYGALSSINLASLSDDKGGERLQVAQITDQAQRAKYTNWLLRFVDKDEKFSLARYLEMEEAVIHRDFRPENILIRHHPGKGTFSYSLCDVTDVGFGPADYDAISLLVDPRLKQMVSLDERRKIHDHYFETTLMPLHRDRVIELLDLNKDQRFVKGAINALVRDIGASFTYIQQRDPKRSLEVQGSLDELPVHPNLPFRDSHKYFGTQYLSLSQVLSLPNRFQNLREGIISFYPRKKRHTLERILADETRHNLLSSIVAKFIASGKKLLHRNGGAFTPNL